MKMLVAAAGALALLAAPAIAQQPQLVQSAANNIPAGLPGDGSGTSSVINPPGSQKCVFTFPHAIATGDTLVGYGHFAVDADNQEIVPQAVTDNVGNSYVLSQTVDWLPWQEGVDVYYLTNIQGNPTSLIFDFSQYPASGNTLLQRGCNVGFSEYSGVSSVTVAGPVELGGAAPAITISPTSPALIWLMTADWWGDNAVPGVPNENTDLLQNSGFQVVLDNWNQDNIVAWSSTDLVQTSPVTLTVNAPGADTCKYSGAYGQPPVGCPTVLTAVALQPAATQPAPSEMNPPKVAVMVGGQSVPIPTKHAGKIAAALKQLCQTLGF